jgi:hypothetical protein
MHVEDSADRKPRVASRFFVTVYAESSQGLQDLRRYDFDLFRATARADAPGRFQIEGLLTLEEVRRLVVDGYSVLVEQHESRRARAADEVGDLSQWLQERQRCP